MMKIKVTRNGLEIGMEYVNIIGDVWFVRLSDELGVYREYRDLRNLKRLIHDFATDKVEMGNRIDYVVEGTESEVDRYNELMRKATLRECGINEIFDLLCDDDEEESSIVEKESYIDEIVNVRRPRHRRGILRFLNGII